MKAKTWQVAGLITALMGTTMLAGAEKAHQGGDQDGHKKDGMKHPSREQMMKKYDTDSNGELSEEERAVLRADMEKRRRKQGGKRPNREQILKKFDTDGDGELSEEERKAMHEAFEARRKEHGQQQGE